MVRLRHDPREVRVTAQGCTESCETTRNAAVARLLCAAERGLRDECIGFAARVRGRTRAWLPAGRAAGRGSVDRDSCWERAARLTVLSNEMAAELERLRVHLAQQPPQTYESLGREARLILTTAESRRPGCGPRRSRRPGRPVARPPPMRTRCGTRPSGRRTRCAPRRNAGPAYGGGCARRGHGAGGRVGRGRRAAAERGGRGAGGGTRRTAQLLRDQEQRQAEEADAAARELAAMEAETDRRVAELDARGKAVRADARTRYAEAEETARHRQEDAEDRAAGLLAQARAEVDASSGPRS